ncbi:hypothetical protein ABFP37_22120 [Burkholderia sp. RS01]|uniref:hypothetical protein n=1 Tax=unclassified Burkholderia TaxID=2613784 RepID=UPI003218A138
MSNGAPDVSPEPRAVPPRKPAKPPRIGTAKEHPASANERSAVRASGTIAASAPPLDNYAAFLGRLDAAAGRLTPRRDALTTALGAAELLHHQNHAGLELWGQRLSRISQILDQHTGNREARTYSTLRELHDIAIKMKQMFGSRAERVQQVCNVIRARRVQINTSLFELEKSKVKLTSSKMLAQERENLSKVVADLSVTGEGISHGFPDPGLQESLREAREAIILAEAPLEVKGN